QEQSPNPFLKFGRPTASATPLMWAHAEYLKLLRSARDNVVFDLIPEVFERYCGPRGPRRRVHVWSFLYPALRVGAGTTLRIIAEDEFQLHWSDDGWRTANDAPSRTNLLDVHYADIETAREPPGRELVFTFRWAAGQRWEGRDFRVAV